MSYINSEISDYKVEIIDGGQVGVETTLRVSARIKAQADTDVTIRKDMAVCQGMVKYWIVDPEWKLIWGDKMEIKDTDYEYPAYTGDGAHADLDEVVTLEYVWLPENDGTYLVPAHIIARASITDGSWPPVWKESIKVENPYGSVEITNPVPKSLDPEQFIVRIGQSVEDYAWNGLVLDEEVNQVGIIDGYEIGIRIPVGTMIMGANEIEVILDGLTPVVVPYVLFSTQPELTVDGI